MEISGDAAAQELYELLKQQDQRIVFAESCTAGLIAATLGRLPGVSQWLAGSAVVYQLATKEEWLQVGHDVLQDPGPVSQVVSEQMARGVLQKTPHATIAASITGHLGPDAPADQDGIAWSSVAVRTLEGVDVSSRCLQLAREIPEGGDLRCLRQEQAAELVLRFCVERLSG